MFIDKYPDDDHKINIYALPGLLNDYKMNIKPGKYTVRLEAILDTVCEFYNVEEAAVMSSTRKRPVVVTRQIFCYLAKKYTKLTLRSIGEFIGKRDHTTVIHSVATVNDLIKYDEQIRSEVITLENNLIADSHALAYDVIGKTKISS